MYRHAQHALARRAGDAALSTLMRVTSDRDQQPCTNDSRQKDVRNTQAAAIGPEIKQIQELLLPLRYMRQADLN